MLSSFILLSIYIHCRNLYNMQQYTIKIKNSRIRPFLKDWGGGCSQLNHTQQLKASFFQIIWLKLIFSRHVLHGLHIAISMFILDKTARVQLLQIFFSFYAGLYVQRPAIFLDGMVGIICQRIVLFFDKGLLSFPWRYPTYQAARNQVQCSKMPTFQLTKKLFQCHGVKFEAGFFLEF